MSQSANSARLPTKGAELNPFAIAVGLMLNDIVVLPLLLVVLAAPKVAAIFGELFGFSLQFWTIALDRIVEIGVMSFVALRWRRRLQSAQGPRLRVLPVITRISFVSIVSWVIFMSPVFGAAIASDSIMAGVFIALVVLGCLWCLRTYFFSALAGMLGLPIGATFFKSAQMAGNNSLLILKSLLAPCGITFVVTTLLLMPYPDGRSAPWLAASSAAEGFFWILSTYVALGFVLTMLSEQEWRAAGLSHYRADRLNTLQTQAGRTLPKYLSPRFGAIMLAVGLCFLAGNMVRLSQLPPAARVEIQKVEVSDYTIRVELQVEDTTYHFRGFEPRMFLLASKTGSPFSTRLLSVSSNADAKHTVAFTPARNGEAMPLFLTFESTKTAEVLRSVDNMWLWYRTRPLLSITPEMLQAAPK